jgi:hypothetical protein
VLLQQHLDCKLEVVEENYNILKKKTTKKVSRFQKMEWIFQEELQKLTKIQEEKQHETFMG